jgi:hypothetical protein
MSSTTPPTNPATTPATPNQVGYNKNGANSSQTNNQASSGLWGGANTNTSVSSAWVSGLPTADTNNGGINHGCVSPEVALRFDVGGQPTLPILSLCVWVYFVWVWVPLY